MPQWQSAPCLLRTLEHGTLVRPGEPAPSEVPLVLLVEALSPRELQRFAATHSLAAVIATNASLADHAAGLANSLGIQLVMVGDILIPAAPTSVIIDGENERLAFVNDVELSSSLESENVGSDGFSLTGTGLSILVDGASAQELAVAFSGKVKPTGIGILRSEWVLSESSTPPTRRVLDKFYREACERVHPHTLNVRLFDIGGDKIPSWCAPHAHLLSSPISNRGIRAMSILPDVYRSQIEALLTLADSWPIGIVAPMVTNADDLELLKRTIMNWVGSTPQVPIGAMIETPSAALSIEGVASEADFLRIGPGDLSQFTLAKARQDIQPREFSGHGFSRPVMALIEHVANVCARIGRPLSLCLDLDPRPEMLHWLDQAGISSLALASRTIQRLNSNLSLKEV